MAEAVAPKAVRHYWVLAVLSGAVTAFLVAYVWGGLRQLPVIHDEAAYLLQAKIFAAGHWTVPSPPLPEFFEQLHVFNTPAVASKYWPAHSLLLAPGAWAGFPGAVPIALWGISGALVFVVAMRIVGVWPGMVVWLLWATGPNALEYRASYFAQSTTVCCWMATLVCLDDWLRTRRCRAAIIGAFALGIGACARPLTMLALVVPAAIVVGASDRKAGQSRCLTAAALALAATLALIPLWSWSTVGRLDTTPYSLYADRYFPFDRPGWRFDARPPQSPLPPDMAKLSRDLGSYFAAHRLDRLPAIAVERLSQILGQSFPGWRLVLIPLGLIGALTARKFHSSERQIFGSAGLLFLLYLNYAHPPLWISYYLEAQFALYLAVGLAVSRLPTRMLGLVAVVVAVLAVTDVAAARRHRLDWQQRADAPASVFRKISAKRAIVFVRFGGNWNLAVSLIRNESALDAAPVWVVRDLGSQNETLRRWRPTERPIHTTLPQLDSSRSSKRRVLRRSLCVTFALIATDVADLGTTLGDHWHYKQGGRITNVWSRRHQLLCVKIDGSLRRS